MKKNVIAAFGALLVILSSCSSANQFYGVATGASVGGMFGSAIGAISGGRHGHDVGRVAGMAIGGVIGAVATTPKTQDGNYRSSDYSNVYDSDDYQANDAYSPYGNLEIQNLRFVDLNNNQYIDANEQAKLVFEIRNMGNDFVYDIAPVITVTGTKQIFLSPTAIISELGPGRAVRYTAEVVATNKLKTGTAEFSISFSDGDKLYTLRTFQLRTRGR